MSGVRPGDPFSLSRRRRALDLLLCALPWPKHRGLGLILCRRKYPPHPASSHENGALRITAPLRPAAKAAWIAGADVH